MLPVIIILSDKFKKREVEKMLLCMDPEIGYTTYMCVDCGNTKKIPHSCKSRICSVCGKKHADEWAEKINKEMYAVPYRHIILTVTDKLWPYFEGNARLQKIMLDATANVMKEIVKEHNGKCKDTEYSIVETSKENGLNPFAYLTYLFEHLPNINVKDQDAIDALLPWSSSLPDYCRVPVKNISKDTQN